MSDRYMTCKTDDLYHLSFLYKNLDENDIINEAKQRNYCIQNGLLTISIYLKSKGLLIRYFTEKDYDYYTSDDYKKTNSICGVFSDSLIGVLSDIEDEIKDGNNYDNNYGKIFITEKKLRLTFVITKRETKNPLTQPPLSLITCIVNFNDHYLKSEYPDMMNKLTENGNIYVELACTTKINKYSKLIAGAGYLLNGYILLVAIKNFPDIDKMWGKAVGFTSKDNSNDALRAMHKKRTCSFYNNSEYYICDPSFFLNELFRRLYLGELLIQS